MPFRIFHLYSDAKIFPKCKGKKKRKEKKKKKKKMPLDEGKKRQKEPLWALSHSRSEISNIRSEILILTLTLTNPASNPMFFSPLISSSVQLGFRRCWRSSRQRATGWRAWASTASVHGSSPAFTVAWSSSGTTAWGPSLIASTSTMAPSAGSTSTTPSPSSSPEVRCEHFPLLSVCLIWDLELGFSDTKSVYFFCMKLFSNEMRLIA